MKQTQVSIKQIKSDETTGQVKESQAWSEVSSKASILDYNLPTTSNLQQTDDQTAIGPEFILYWIDEFNKLPDNIKNEIRKETQHDIFNNFSDSIGSLLNAEFIKDRSTVPVSDIGDHITDYTHNFVLDHAIPPATKQLQDDLSSKCSNMFKRNMTFIKDDTGIASLKSTDCHGRNLITDTQHYERMLETIPQSHRQLRFKLGALYQVLTHIRQNKRYRAFFSTKSRELLEDKQSLIDLFGTYIETSYKSDSTNSSFASTLEAQELPET